MVVSSGEAIKKLKEGNKKYHTDKMKHPNCDQKRRDELKEGQKPWAVVVTCSDSRVPPELIFDTGLGEIFVIRIAGNVVDDTAMASIEYGVHNLGCKLVVVMGHEKCGAVGAAVDGVKQGHLASITDRMKDSVKRAKESGVDDVLAAAIEFNAKAVAEEIKNSKPILNEADFEVLPAYYNFDGEVIFFDQQQA